MLTVGHFPSPLWGGDHCNTRGHMLENLFSTMNLCILNNGSVTYIHPASGSTSALDLSVCSPSLVLDYKWSTHDDLCGSYHFPVVLNATSKDEDPSLNRWNFGKADCLSFRALCQSRLTGEAVLSAEDPTSIFTSLLIDSAEESKPKTYVSSNTPPPKVPWFNEQCK